MDKAYLKDVAEFAAVSWWKKFSRVYSDIGNCPKMVLNNRLKTTAGRCHLDHGFIDLSTELFWQYTENFVKDTIPHELAHMVAYRVYGDEGHGKDWYSVIDKMGIPTSRLHNMVNSKWANRK